jgi:hypothetical protein
METERRFAREQYDRVLLQVLELEVQMGITKRWTPETTEYADTARYICERRYHRALNKLQRLVTQRLFELHRLNLSGIGMYLPFRNFIIFELLFEPTGYKARTHLAKSLQTRCKTIRSATDAYNRAARSLNPPRPPLDWAQVSRYSFLEEFNLLRNTQRDITAMPWTKPAIRETIKKYLRVCRAREELERCNVEVRRVLTSIRDEDHQFGRAIQRLKDQKSGILGPVIEYCTHRRRVNSLLLGHIRQIFDLDGYTGSKLAGCKRGSRAEGGKGTDNAAYDNEDFGGDDGEEIDEGEMNLVDGLLDFVTKL